MMLARLLPLLLLCACASAAHFPEIEQPELSQLAKPYAQQLRAVGITRVVSAGSGAMVRLETLSGPVYIRYPHDVSPFAFVLEVDPEGFACFVHVLRPRARCTCARCDPARRYPGGGE